ncbi:hypothetical protein FRC03_001659 [Tulasnella sp. 419]|nr:hypothetical protein FRC03_001659 [Tulasnella sp. 419]
MVFRTNWILYSSYPSVLNRHPVSLKIDANCYGSKKSSSRKQSDAPINQEETEDSPPLSAKSEESMATKASSPPLMALKYLATGAQMDSSSQKMGVAWAGYYEDGDHVVEIVAKLDLVNRLVGEALVYERLQQKKGGGVPTCLGMYRTEEFPKNGVLVMSNNGRSVVHDKGISAAERDMLVKILEDIHDCGVLHNNLTEKHILRNNRAMLSIAGFHYADVYDVNDKFRSLASLEMQRFRALLDELVQPAGPTN